MKIIVWGINYSPEVTGIGPYNTGLCEHLNAKGHSVRMVTTFPYYPGWAKVPGDRKYLYRTDNLDGFPVHRCWHYVPRRPSPIKRIVHEGTFVLFSFLRLLFLARPDLYVVISPPLLLGAAAWLLTRLKRAPFIFHVQDMQPDAALGLGMLKQGLMVRALYWLEKFAYKKADRLSGISHGMTRAFQEKGVAESKIIYFPNGVELPRSVLPSGEFRKRFSLTPDDFLVVYSGNLGVKQGLDVLIDAARLVRNPNIRFVICGDGAQRELLAQRLRMEQITNVLLLPLQPKFIYEQLLMDTDLSVITQRSGSGDFFFPSKLLAHLSFAKPVLTVSDPSSELARAVKSGGFGINVEPADPRKLAHAIEFVARDPKLLSKYAVAGRQFVQQFDLNEVLRRFEDDLQAFVSGRSTLPPSEQSSASPGLPCAQEAKA